ncbi:MAG: DUF1211 domain-containing protein [Leifsonia sp.]|nr:DUF1211 domain-containing protein [Leifsonia sp.]
MSTLRARYASIFGHGRMTERVVFFSDAVFAIALTLLVVDLRVPEVDNGETSGDVIVSLLPGFMAYAISFAVIALNWNGHHRKFRVINGFDSRLIQLNFVLLFLVAFTPFPTSLMSEYPGEVPSVVLYAVVVAMLSVVQLAMWAYAWRRGLVDAIVEPDMYRYVRRNLLVVPIVFGISILIALFWDATIAMYSWLVLIPLTIIVARVGTRKPSQPAD